MQLNHNADGRALLALIPLLAVPVLALILHDARTKPYLQFDPDQNVFETTYDRGQALELADLLDSRRGHHMRSNFAALGIAALLARALDGESWTSRDYLYSSDGARAWLTSRAGNEIRDRVHARDRVAWLCVLAIAACLIATVVLCMWVRTR